MLDVIRCVEAYHRCCVAPPEPGGHGLKDQRLVAQETIVGGLARRLRDDNRATHPKEFAAGQRHEGMKDTTIVILDVDHVHA